MNDTDDSQALVERVVAASASAQALAIQGGGSKAFLGVPTTDSSAEVLSTLTHSGVVSYEPTELVVTARSGTRLDDLIRVSLKHSHALNLRKDDAVPITHRRSHHLSSHPDDEVVRTAASVPRHRARESNHPGEFRIWQ